MDKAGVSKILAVLTERLGKSNRYEEFVSAFKESHSDDERIACLYNLEETQGLFTTEENFKVKCKREAEILRAEGNERFKVGDYQGAISWYTQSIIKAPDDSENLSLAFNNRSTANFYLKNYALCLQDIELAFSHNYPSKSCYKLYQRIGRCMYYMYNKEEAIKAFQQTISALEIADLDDDNKQSMVADMLKVIEQCSSIKSPCMSTSVSGYNCCHKGIPCLVSKPSKQLPCVSDAIEIRLDSYGGRGLFATRNIEVGEVVIVETPYSSALLKDFNLTHCQYCCNRVNLAVPCKHCSAVVFCSLQCRNAAWWKFHWAECKVLENLQDSKGDLSFLSSRMVLSAGFEELVKLRESDVQTDLRNTGFDEEGVYNSEDYRSAYSLVNHADKRTFNDLLNRSISALYYLKYLEFIGFFSPSITKNKKMCTETVTEEKQDLPLSAEQTLQHKYCIGGHLLRNSMMLPCNAHEVSEFALILANPAMSTTTELAAGVYPVLSLINHSCDPSVVRHSYGNICVARAIRSIAAGEELKDNYGALYPTMDLKTRQTNLAAQYFFQCSCEACLSNWPQYFEIPCDRPIFRCTKCNGCVPIPVGDLTELAKCSSCGQSQDITRILLQMGEMEDSYKNALTSVIEGNNSNSNITTLLSYLKFVERHVHRPWRDINDCQEAFKQCLNMHANCYPVECG